MPPLMSLLGSDSFVPLGATYECLVWWISLEFLLVEGYPVDEVVSFVFRGHTA